MSTVVDNNKYIINGGTLSDIGDSLKSKGLLDSTKQTTTKTVWYKKVEGVSYINITSEWFGLNRTVSQAIIFSGTAAESRNYQGTDSNFGTNDRLQYLNYNNRYYTVKLPAYFSSRMGKIAGVKVYPISANGDYIIPTENEREGYFSEQKQIKEETERVSIANLVSSVLSHPSYGYALLNPFTIGGNTSASSGTNLSQYISSITDIEVLIFRNSSYTYLLRPTKLSGQTQKTYPLMRIYCADSSSLPSNWESSMEQNGSVSFYDSYSCLYNPNSYSSAITAKELPALLIYKKSVKGE